MWRIYNNQTNLKVKPSYFRTIFVQNLISASVRRQPMNVQPVFLWTRGLRYQKRTKENKIWLFKSNCIWTKLEHFIPNWKTKMNKCSLYYLTTKKNQVLPRVTDQSAYCSRQMYMYNLTFVIGHSKAPQTKVNVFNFFFDR